MECPVEEINAYLHETFSDPERDLDLGSNGTLISPKSPDVDFDLKAPTFKEVQEVVKAARTRSAPGPNGVPYIVYKRCPGILKLLWKTLRTVWKREIVAIHWRQAE